MRVLVNPQQIPTAIAASAENMKTSDGLSSGGQFDGESNDHAKGRVAHAQ